MKIKKLLFSAIVLLVFVFYACSPSLKIAEYAVTEKSAFANNKIGAIPLEKYDVKILRIKRKGEFLRHFDKKTKILLNDTLYLLGTSAQLEKIYRYYDKKK